MLNARYRFHSRGGVLAARAHGQKVFGREIAAVAVENPRGRTRIAVIISKKVLKSAVGRNRIRRRVYEAVRRVMPLERPFDILFLVQSAAVKDLPFEELQAKIQRILTNILTNTK